MSVWMEGFILGMILALSVIYVVWSVYRGLTSPACSCENECGCTEKEKGDVIDSHSECGQCAGCGMNPKQQN